MSTKTRHEILQHARAAYSEKVNKLAANVVSYFDEQYPISAKDVAAHFSIGERRVYRYLKKAGRQLPPQQRRKIDMEKVKQAHRLHDKLQNKAAVARQMKCSAMQVARYLKISADGEGV